MKKIKRLNSLTMLEKNDLDRLLLLVPLVKAVAELSKDNSVKVGAIAVDQGFNILGVGYNGLAKGVKFKPDRVEGKEKLLWTCHAEENLVAQCANTGVSLKNATVIVVGRFPCSTCARLLIQSGVKKVLGPELDKKNKWYKHNLVSIAMFQEAGVTFYLTEELSSKKLDLDVT